VINNSLYFKRLFPLRKLRGRTGDPARDAARGVDRDLWRLALPMIAANLSVPLLGAVDAALLGHLPEPAYLAGVAIGTTLLTALYWAFGFLRMGTTGLASQASGRAPGEAARVLPDAALLALAAGALVVLVGHWGAPSAVALMTGAEAVPTVAPPDPLVDPAIPPAAGAFVDEQALTYIRIRLFSAPVALLTFVALGWLIGLGRTGAVLWTGLLTNGLNIALDVLLIRVLDLRAAGAALATVGAEVAGLALVLALALPRWRALTARAAPAGPRPTPWPLRIRRLLALNGNLFLRTLLLLAVLTWITARVGRLGAAPLAANAIAMSLFYFASHGLDGLAQAAEVLCGRALGARDLEAFHRATRRAALWTGVVGLGAALVYASAGSALGALYTDLPEVRAALAPLLPAVALVPLVAAACFLLDGVFVGATRGAAMRDTMAFAALAVFAPLTVLLEPLGHAGLWWAFLAFLAARGLGLALVYGRLTARGRWMDGGATAP
jgi:MATE family multidrug resistance protein